MTSFLEIPSWLAELSEKQPLVIAEIGANYGGIDTVCKMVESAVDCGADIIKFQTYKAETVSTPNSFFTMEDGSKVSQFDFFKAYELSHGDHILLNDLCGKLGVKWVSTPSHSDDVELLEEFDLPFYKTGSDDLTNLPFLRYIARKGRPMVVSTGMCTLAEIEAAVEAIFSEGNKDLVLLHCVVSYPSVAEDANLKVIQTLQNAFGLPVGLSDHTQDEFTSILATQLGAVIIEKHFTLDHSLKQPDHEASLDPIAFRCLVGRVHQVPQALGNGIKTILETEKKWRKASRKSLFARIDIPVGKILTEDDIKICRPSDGLHPRHLPLILGRTALCDIPAGTLLDWSMV